MYITLSTAAYASGRGPPRSNPRTFNRNLPYINNASVLDDFVRFPEKSHKSHWLRYLRSRLYDAEISLTGGSQLNRARSPH